MLSTFINTKLSPSSTKTTYETEVTSPFQAFEPGKLDQATAEQFDKIPT
jgi:hypothetical protein